MKRDKHCKQIEFIYKLARNSDAYTYISYESYLKEVVVLYLKKYKSKKVDSGTYIIDDIKFLYGELRVYQRRVSDGMLLWDSIWNTKID